MPSLELSPSGLVVTHWDPHTQQHLKQVIQPATSADLLRFWHYDLRALVPGYSLRHLFDLLLRLQDPEGLGPLLACDLEAFLDEAHAALVNPNPHSAPAVKTDPEHKLLSIVVQGFAELVRHSPAANIVEDEPLGSIPEDYVISYDVSGLAPMTEEPYEGYFAEFPHAENSLTHYAIELSPLASLLPLPLQFNSAVTFYPTSYSQGDPVFSTRLGITFGQFVQALFWEIGFLGAPATRDAKKADLDATVSQIDAAEDALSYSENYLDKDDDKDDKDDTEGKYAGVGFRKFSPEDILAEIKEKRDATHPQELAAAAALSTHGASLAAHPAALAVLVEGTGARAGLVVLVSSPVAVVSIPPRLGSVPVAVRVVDSFSFDPQE